MAFRSILTVLSDPEVADQTVDVAASFAGERDAHLDALCVGVDRTQTGFYDAGASATLLQTALEAAQREADALEEQVRARLKNADVRWGVETGVVQIMDLARSVAARARFSDLVIQPKPYGKGRGGVDLEAEVEGALFEGQAPVLVLPEGFAGPVKTNKIVLAWNESAESLVAARAALPLIVEADAVHVVVIDPPQHGPNRSDPGGLLSQYLARHGAKVEVDVLSKSMPRVSDVLNRHVSDLGADMIVMGAYGHSRFREAILGGATRNMLENCPVPVFMAH